MVFPAVEMLKRALQDVAKAAPTEEEEREVVEKWGNEFAKGLRQLREMAGVCGAKLDEDDEVEGCIRVAQEALGRYEDRSWLEWAGKELMPRLAEEVAAEEAEKAREEAEEREKRATEAKLAAEEAKREAEAEREAARQRREEERQAERDRKSGELLQRFQANAITGQEFQDGLAALEKDSSDGEMEQEDAAMEIVEVPKVQAGMKRREREDEEMTSATGDNRKCDRCAEFKSDVKCFVVEGASKCKKCDDDRKGCHWDGFTLAGVPKPTRKGGEKKQEAKKAVVKKEKVAEGKKDVARGRPGLRAVSQYVGAVPAAASTSRALSKSAKGKGRMTGRSEELEAVQEQMRKIQGQLVTLERQMEVLEKREEELIEDL